MSELRVIEDSMKLEILKSCVLYIYILIHPLLLEIKHFKKTFFHLQWLEIKTF